MTGSIREAQLKTTDAGLIAQGEGWFVVNARDVSWVRSAERGQDTDFEGAQEWTQLGFRIHVLMRGQVNEEAAKHGASVLEETSKPDEAYSRFSPEARSAYGEGWLP